MIIHTEINDAIMFSFNGNAGSSEKYIMKKEIIGRDPWNKKGVNYFSCMEGKGGLRVIHCSAQKATLFVDL